MQGRIQSKNGKAYVVTTYDEQDEPFRQYQWWIIEQSRRNPYNLESPRDGDDARYAGENRWVVSRPGVSNAGEVWTRRDRESSERVAVPPPPARGRQLRWYYGRWERLTARGWVPAGEGTAAPPPAKKRRTRKQLDQDIEEELARDASTLDS